MQPRTTDTASCFVQEGVTATRKRTVKLHLILIPALLTASAATFGDKSDGRWQGPISIEKAQARATERFADVDANGDGKVTPDELFSEERRAARITEKQQRKFERLDADGDGAITAEEFAKRIERLAKLDQNNDGTVTRDELRAGKRGKDSKRRRDG